MLGAPEVVGRLRRIIRTEREDSPLPNGFWLLIDPQKGGAGLRNSVAGVCAPTSGTLHELMYLF